MTIEFVQNIGEAYQFPTAIGDYAGTEWSAAAAKDLSHIMIWKNNVDFEKIQYPEGKDSSHIMIWKNAEFHRLQAPALYHRGTELVCMFQYATAGLGWQLAVERWPGVFAVATGGPVPVPTPTPTPAPPSGDVDLSKWEIVSSFKLKV